MKLLTNFIIPLKGIKKLRLVRGGEGGELFLGEEVNQSKGVHDKNDEDDIDAE